MTRPRRVLPGGVYMVTRRCTQRQFLLLPTHVSVQVFRYCLALAQRATGVKIHAVCVLSNHYHIVLTDVFGNLPRFSHLLNMLVAKCMNAYYGRWENLFAAGVQPSHVQLIGDDTILAKMVYTITNTVKDGLVRTSEQWPGLLLWRPNVVKARRPNFFFKATDEDAGACPAVLPLIITPPPLEQTSSTREILRLVDQLREEEERAVRVRFRSEKRKFLGRARILAQKPTDSPWKKAPRRRLSPVLACRDKWRRAELLQASKQFLSEYRDAWNAYAQGAFDVVFPAGTYLMNQRFSIRCADN